MMAGYGDAMRGNMAAALNRRGAAVPTAAEQGPRQFDGRKNLPGACQIEIDRIVPDPDQPRVEFDQADIEELAASIVERGQLQPVRVRWDQSLGRYVIILGERRYRAAVSAGLPSLACVVVEDAATPADRLEDQIVENMLRADLKPVEQARSFRRLIDLKGYTQAELATRLRIKRESVTQALQLLELPESVRAAVDDGKISASSAYEIAKVADPAEQARIADEAIAGDLRRADVRERVAQATKPKGRGGKPKVIKLPTSRVIRTADGCRVTVEHRKGITPRAALAALEDAAARVRAELDAAEAA